MIPNRRLGYRLSRVTWSVKIFPDIVIGLTSPKIGAFLFMVSYDAPVLFFLERLMNFGAVWSSIPRCTLAFSKHRQAYFAQYGLKWDPWIVRTNGMVLYLYTGTSDEIHSGWLQYQIHNLSTRHVCQLSPVCGPEMIVIWFELSPWTMCSS